MYYCLDGHFIIFGNWKAQGVHSSRITLKGQTAVGLKMTSYSLKLFPGGQHLLPTSWTCIYIIGKWRTYSILLRFPLFSGKEHTFFEKLLFRKFFSVEPMGMKLERVNPAGWEAALISNFKWIRGINQDDGHPHRTTALTLRTGVRVR